MSRPAPAPVPGPLCIALNRVGAASERFIERHIRESFGGHTVVLARRCGPAPAFAQPLLEAEAVAPRGPRAWATLPGQIAAYARWRHWGVPTGPLRQHILAFWREHGVQAVLAEFGPLGCWLAPLARDAGLPLFVYFRGYDASSKLRSARTVQAYRRMVPQVAGLFAVSQYLVDRLKAAGVEHPNTHVIPSGTDPRRFRPAEVKDPDLVVSVGRLVEKKRPEATLRAFAAARADHPGLRLALVGDGPLRSSCEALARSLGVAEQVQFLGSQPHDAVAALLGRATLYLQHSVTARSGETEGLPSSIQEAMASGAVVISTRHAGIPEAVQDGLTGWTVAEHDDAAYAAALRQALADRPRLDAMAAEARRWAVTQLDTARLQARLEAVIQQRGEVAPNNETKA